MTRWEHLVARCGSDYMTTVVIWEVAVREIQLKDAKASLSAVIDEAVKGHPAIITRHGRKQAVVLSFEDYEKLANVPSFGRLLASFPGDEGDIPPRGASPARAVVDF